MKSFHYMRLVSSFLTFALLALAVVVFPASVRAADKGQDDLDKATQLKLGRRARAISPRSSSSAKAP